MNGQFNSLTEDATFGVWGGDVIVDAGGYAVDAAEWRSVHGCRRAPTPSPRP